MKDVVLHKLLPRDIVVQVYVNVRLLQLLLHLIFRNDKMHVIRVRCWGAEVGARHLLLGTVQESLLMKDTTDLDRK